MALQDISQVSITLESSGVSRAGFGVPMFMTITNSISSRIESYSSLSEVSDQFGTDSPAYSAAQSVFSNNPSVDTFKIGRIIPASEVFTPDAWVDGLTVSVTITDNSGQTIDSVIATQTYDNVTYTTAELLVSDLVSQIKAALGSNRSDGGEQTVEATDNGDGTFSLTSAASYDYTTSDLLAISSLSTPAETLLEAYDAIIDVDNDFYAVATEIHKDVDTGGTDGDGSALTQILDLADTIEASDSYKIYFVGSAASESITDVYTEGDTPLSTNDIMAYLNFNNLYRSIGWWSDQADNDFEELAFAGYNLPFDAGSVVWGNIQVPVSAAQNEDGNALTTSQQQKLSDRNANWATIKGGVVYAREGKVASGEWIDSIRGRDSLKSDLEADLFDLLTNQQGGKIPYTDPGINVVSGVVETRLNDYKDNRGFLTDPITITVPKAKNVTPEDKSSRTLEMSFNATLAGAIMLVKLQGNLEI